MMRREVDGREREREGGGGGREREREGGKETGGRLKRGEGQGGLS